jgi:hypothetical protein
VEQKRRINRVSDLPDWFDLTKYEGLAALDVHGWSYQIWIRSLMNQWLKKIEDTGEFLFLVKMWLTSITKNPSLIRTMIRSICISGLHSGKALR